MSIDLSRVTGISDSRGVITEIKDSLGRVIWSAVKEVGALIFRPSADISIEHTLYPSGSTSAYLLINEEVADSSSTYIKASKLNSTPSIPAATTSKFRLSSVDQIPTKRLLVTSVNVIGETYCSTSGAKDYTNDFILDINGVETSTVTVNSQKSGFDLSVLDAVSTINNYIATHGTLPNVNLTVISYASNQTIENKGRDVYSGVTQVYVVLGYEA